MTCAFAKQQLLWLFCVYIVSFGNYTRCCAGCLREGLRELVLLLLITSRLLDTVTTHGLLSFENRILMAFLRITHTFC